MLGPFPLRAAARRITIHQVSLLSRRTPPMHRCLQRRRRRRRQRQRVTEGTAMAPWNGPKKERWKGREGSSRIGRYAIHLSCSFSHLSQWIDRNTCIRFNCIKTVVIEEHQTCDRTFCTAVSKHSRLHFAAEKHREQDDTNESAEDAVIRRLVCRHVQRQSSSSLSRLLHHCSHTRSVAHIGYKW